MSKRFKKVVSVTTSVTTILWLSGVAALAPMAAFAATIAEGDTIKTADNPDVYIAKYVGAKKFKRLILNPAVFNSYGHLSWSKIKTVTQAEMDAFTTSDLVRALGDAKVYKLVPNGDEGSRQWVNMSAEAFTAANYDWDSIYVINNTDRDNYATGSDITGGTSASPSVSPSTSVAAGSLAVALASDTPAAGVAVEYAARMPFTKVNFTAGASDVTITGLAVQRTGLADDAVISSVVLIDAATNTQVGLSQTLNAAHQVTFTDTLTIPANTTKSYNLAANMPASSTGLNNYSGQLASLSLVGVTTSATVTGSLPITGNAQNINSTLTIGSATAAIGSLDPSSAFSKEVGTTGYTFSSMKVTAGSTEDITIYSIKWNQAGSAATSDLANVIVTDGSTNYATTVSSDGKYYTASFGTAGITIAKGLNKEFSVKGDIANGSARTVSFDIYKNTDIVVKGNLYGYYLTSTFTDNGVTHSSANATDVNNTTSPYFAGAHVTIGNGSLRIDKNSALAPAANLAEGGTGLVLGAFDFVVQGEAVNVASMILDLTQTGTGSSSDIDNVKLVKEDGTVVAGPVNAETVANGTGTATFTGTVSFPIGTTKLKVIGDVTTAFAANDTIIVGFNTPDARITSITGATTGNSITASPTAALTCNTMTVKAGALIVKVLADPVAQTIVKGTQNFTFANLYFDASTSGENIKVTSIAVQDGAYTASTQDDIVNMELWDGSTLLNSTTVNGTESATASTTVTFTLSTPLVITKGQAKTIALKADVINGATAALHEFGLADATATVVASGVSTGSSIAETITASNGQAITIATSGQFAVALDSANPVAALVSADTTVEFTRLKFSATTEAISLTNLRLELTSASSTGIDLASVTIYDGTTPVSNSQVFIGAGASATADFTFTPSIAIPKNGDKVLIVKGVLAKISTGEAGTAGHTVSINFDGSDNTKNYGTGGDSGATIYAYNSDTAANRMSVYKSFPTVTENAVRSFTTSGTATLNTVTVTADSKSDIDLYKLTFYIATSSSVALTNLTVYDGTSILYASSTNWYVDTYGNRADFVLRADPGTTATAVPLQIPAGTTKTLVLKGALTYSGTNATYSASAELAGDGAVTAKASTTYGLTAANVDADSNDDFIWSDRSAASHGTGTADWYNGYLVKGLSTSY